MRQIYYIDVFPMENKVENYDILKDFDDNPQLKILHFAYTSFINDGTLILFASVFPNLQLLDLSFCYGISKKGISQVVSRCCKFRNLDLTLCNNLRGLKMNFVVSELEVF